MAHVAARKPYRFCRVCVAFATAMPVSEGLAQEPVASQESRQILEEIIVTATRRSSSVRDVPFNISAITGEAIDRLHLSQLSDLSRHVPGLIVVDQGNRAADRIVVRGLNAASLNESATLFNTGGDTVATYIGEIPVYVDLRLRDLERVEVLLGPQGTLYGAGTLGGAIRYLPKSPDTREWAATISAAGFGQSESDGKGSDIWAVINAPLVRDRLALRASISRYDDPGFIDYPLLLREPGFSNPQPDFNDPADVAANLFRVDDADAGEILSARAALKWDINDAVSTTLNYYYQDTDFGGRTINHRHALGIGKYESGHRVLEPNQRENQLISLEVNADLSFADLVAATGVSRYEDLGQRDQSDLVFFLELGKEFNPNFVDITRDATNEERFNQEVRLVSKNTGPWNWIAGAFFNRLKFSHNYKEFVPGTPEFEGVDRPDNLFVVIALDSETKETAAFGELGYQITDQWQVSVGMRRFGVDFENAAADDFPYFATADGVYGPDEVRLERQAFTTEDTGTLFKFNTSYRFSEKAMGYLTVSEGYRLGGINAAPQCPDGQTVPLFCLLPGEVFYKPDKTLNYELGLRSTWMDGQIDLNAAIFHIDWQDFQLDALSADGSYFITVNGGDAVSDGLELAMQAYINDRWLGSVTYAYTHAELSSFAPGAVDGADGFSGDRLPGTPEHQLSAQLTYSVPLSPDWMLDLDYSISYTSDVYTKVGLRNNGEVLPGYSIHNVAATFMPAENWAIRLFIDNLFNKFAETNVRPDQSFIRDVGLHTLRTYYRNVLRPRRFGAEVRYEFDF